MLPHTTQTPICDGRVGAKVLSHTLRFPFLSAYTMQLTFGFFNSKILNFYEWSIHGA